MTLETVIRLALFNGAVGVVGAGAMIAIAPRFAIRALVRLGGVALLAGYALTMVFATLLLSLGLRVTPTTLAVGGLVVWGLALVRRHRATSTETNVEQRESAWSLTPIGAIPLALGVVALQAVFRRGRLEGLLEFDGWNSWGPKAKALFYTGGLDPEFLQSLPGGSYPPGVPAVLSAAMHAIGSADVVSVHLQYAFFGLAFVWALIGLLAPRVEPLLVAPFVLLVFVMPDVRSRAVDMYGDLPLGYLIAAASLLVLLWVLDEVPWGLAIGTLLLAGAAVTKREALLFVGGVLLAAALATISRRRVTWPRLGVAFLLALVAPLSWSIWLRLRGLPGNGPEGGASFLTDLGRLGASLQGVVENLFDSQLWLLSTTLAIAALVLAGLARAWTTVVYATTLFVVSTIGCALILWSTPSLELSDINVISRLNGTAVLLLVTLTPVLLQHAWGGSAQLGRTARPGPRAGRLALVIVLGAAVVYPLRVMAGGLPEFPGRWDCRAETQPGAPAVVVLDHVASYADALALGERAEKAGLGASAFLHDGCGRLLVALGAALPPDEALRLATRARDAGIDAGLEGQPPGAPTPSYTGGIPVFASSACARVATSDADGELELVFGRFESERAARELRERVVTVGFVGTEVEADGCGAWKVANDGIDSFAQGLGTIEEARRAGFDPRLEVDPGP